VLPYVTSAKEGINTWSLFLCLLSTVRYNYRTVLNENFITDVTVEKKLKRTVYVSEVICCRSPEVSGLFFFAVLHICKKSGFALFKLWINIICTPRMRMLIDIAFIACKKLIVLRAFLEIILQVHAHF